MEKPVENSPEKTTERAKDAAWEKAIEAAKKLTEEGLDRNAYRAAKRELIGLEEENTGEIMLQKCAGEGDWFEVADNSALIYYYYVCQVLKIKGIRFEDDYDSFYEQYRIGRIRVRGADTMRNRLQKVGLYDGEHIVHGRIVFPLLKPLTKERMKILREKEAKRRLKLNQTIAVEQLDPLFYRDLSMLLKTLHHNCSSKMNKATSQTNGERIMTLVDGVMETYLHMADLPKSRQDEVIEDWKEMRHKLYHLKYEIQILEIARIWSLETCLRAFEAVIQLKKLAEKNLMKALKEKEKGGENGKQEEVGGGETSEAEGAAGADGSAAAGA